MVVNWTCIVCVELLLLHISLCLLANILSTIYIYNLQIHIKEEKSMISLVIPVYNTESELIDRVIRSIEKQDYAQYEIIIVNDGSTLEDTNQYLQKISSKEKIKVISTPNMGVSNARNIGMLHCTGDIIIFADADDELKPCFFSVVEKLFLDDSIDALFCGLDFIDSKTNDLLKRTCCLENKVYSSQNPDIITQLLLDESNDTNINGMLLGAVYGKAYRSKTLKNIQFKTGISKFEDKLFILEYLSSSIKQIYFLKDSFYNYYQYNNSSLHSTNSNDCDSIEKLLTNIYLYTQIDSAILFKFSLKLYRYYLMQYIKTKKGTSDITSVFCNMMSSYFKNKRLRVKDKMYLYFSQTNQTMFKLCILLNLKYK